MLLRYKRLAPDLLFTLLSTMPNWTHQIPGSLLKAFLNIAKESKCSMGNHIETLGLLVGFQENGILTGTDLIFPGQKGSPSLVIDTGRTLKCLKLSCLIRKECK